MLIQSTYLLAIDRWRENRGNDFELPDAIVVVASIHRYLTHQELLADGSSLTVGDASLFTNSVVRQPLLADKAGLESPTYALAWRPVPEPGTLAHGRWSSAAGAALSQALHRMRINWKQPAVVVV